MADLFVGGLIDPAKHERTGVRGQVGTRCQSVRAIFNHAKDKRRQIMQLILVWNAN
ncbi:hypothetical protein BH10ACT2_BH10ACT2_28860 [soil metagenome]